MRSRDGPHLALGCLGSLVLLGAVIAATASDNYVVSGVGMIALGHLIAATSREVAELFRHWSWPPMPWPVWVVFGLAVVGIGVARLVAA
jgi:hypothetical protein